MKERKKIAPLMEKELSYPETRNRSPWRSAKRHPILTIIVIILVALLVLAIVGGYFFDWSWTGFTSSPPHTKTLWDWLQLLIIPAVLALAGYAIDSTISNNIQRNALSNDAQYTTYSDDERDNAPQPAQTQPEIAIDYQQEIALQAYIDKLSELLLHEHLRESQPMSEVRKIARVRTLTALSRLDGERKGSVLQSLHEAHLIDQGKPILDLARADLARANLRESDLSGAQLARVNLREADLSHAHLARVNLQEANLSGAHLEGANLSGAHLEGANLSGAHLEGANLLAATLEGADLTGARGMQEKLKDRV